jgi:hypothetical protein
LSPSWRRRRDNYQKNDSDVVELFDTMLSALDKG